MVGAPVAAGAPGVAGTWATAAPESARPALTRAPVKSLCIFMALVLLWRKGAGRQRAKRGRVFRKRRLTNCFGRPSAGSFAGAIGPFGVPGELVGIEVDLAQIARGVAPGLVGEVL